MRRWFAADHETVGTLYLCLAAVLLVVAGAAALVVRAELFAPGLAFLAPAEFNRAVTAHGMFAVFGVAFPACAGLASRMVPAMTGARDMAFPRTNAVSFWLLAPALVLLAAALYGAAPERVGGAAGVGRWPTVPADDAVMFAGGVLLVAVSWMLCGWNVATTVWWRRSPDTPLARLPVFARTMALSAATWVVLGASLALWALTLVNASVGRRGAGRFPLRVLVPRPPGQLPRRPAGHRRGHRSAERKCETAAVRPGRHRAGDRLARGPGAPCLAGPDDPRQESRRRALLPLRGPACRGARGRHCGQLGGDALAAALPLDASVSFALAAALFLALGAVAGVLLPLGARSAGSAVEAAHAHYLFVGFALFGLFAGVYRWLPLWTGRACDETLGRVHFWLSFVGLNATFLPQYLAGASGMLRRIPDYPLMLADLNAAATVGGFLLGFAQLLFLFVVGKAVWATENGGASG